MTLLDGVSCVLSPRIITLLLVRVGGMMQGKKTITPEQIPRILAALDSDDIPSCKDLAARFGVSKWTIWRIKNAARTSAKN